VNTSQTAGKIVVGVDGSNHSRRVLTWALNEARFRGVGCVIVHAWEYGLTTSTLLPGEAPVVLSEDAEALLARGVEFGLASGVPVEGMLVFGAASRALLDASQDALLVVVGSHGRGALASALLGSVSLACVHHAACPVVVVTAEGRADKDAATPAADDQTAPCRIG
jgi:nucleotide-binding universal stress UspA family protein